MDTKESRKNEILKASIGIMHLKGYNGTSVKEITTAAGIPKGSFYNYFEDKEQYAVDAVNYYYDVSMQEGLAILRNKDLEPLERVKELYRSAIRHLEKSDMKRGCFVGNLSLEMGDVSVPIANATAGFHDKVGVVIKEQLVEACEDKVLRSVVDIQILTNFIVNSWQGALLSMKSKQSREPLDDFYTVLEKVLLVK